MIMAAVGAPPFTAKECGVEAWRSVDIALQRWAASLLTRTASLLSMGTHALQDKDEWFIKHVHIWYISLYLKKVYLLYSIYLKLV